MAVVRRALALFFACAAREVVGAACFFDQQENATTLSAELIDGLTICLKSKCENMDVVHLFNASGGNNMTAALKDPCMNFLMKDIKCSTKWADVLILGYSAKAFIPPKMWGRTWGDTCPTKCMCCGNGDCTVDPPTTTVTMTSTVTKTSTAKTEANGAPQGLRSSIATAGAALLAGVATLTRLD
mmetsp:Transcript_164476/g.527515  ORF Transcript_164476/g.527515 Transcript_164476/m.527515 type:complete len:184 (-) Transcript_164476:103-654(-)